MNIDIRLSDQSIQNAITRLQNMIDNIDNDVQQSVEVIAKDGSLIAQAYYRSMAVATDMPISQTQCNIVVSGGDKAIIAEFGAGDATIENTGAFFQGKPPVPVYRGSYSELVGSGQYAKEGRWEFPPGSNRWMTEVAPRQGLYHAKEWIIANGTNVAKGVIKP